MGTLKLLCRDVIEALRPLPPDLFHGCLCDPPYGLSKNGSAGGFMGKRWDARVPGVEYWAEVLRVLKPGAPILCFGGTRTFHRLACAIEDAGFEIFDSILGSVWITGQGFPKSLDISKAIDKKAGVDRVVVGRYCPPEMKVWNLRRAKDSRNVEVMQSSRNNLDITAPTTDDAALWDGYGTALKPAWEPVVFARKPLSGTYAENCIEHGCGGLNIDGSRIGTREKAQTQGSYAGSAVQVAGRRSAGKIYPESLGRYPANLILSHHPECEDAGGCHPECPVAALDRQSGHSGPTGRPNCRDREYASENRQALGKDKARPYMAIHMDSGGASRFFQRRAWTEDELSDLANMRYCAKVSTAERNAGGVTNRHSTLKPLSLTTYLARLILPPPHISSRLLVPFCGTGSEVAGALIAGWGHVVGIDNDPESIDTAQLRIPGLIARGTK